jgi:pimeloyl-ACP methyl ester carboxylesterase
MKKGSFLFNIFFLFILFSCSSSRTDTTSQNETTSLPQVKSVFINGDSLHYIDVGKGDPIVLIHGSLGDYRTWGGQMDTFTQNHRVIAYSRRYAFPNKQIFTDSADYSVMAHAEDLAEFLKVLNLGPVHLVGHSYGAATALSTTLDHPELVRSLILGEPPAMSLLQDVPGGDTLLNNFVTRAMMPAGEAFKNNQDEKAVSTFIAGVMGDTMYYSQIPERDRAFMMTNTLEMRGTVLSNKNPFPPVTCDDLKKIDKPVLLVKGDKSPQLFISITGVLSRCISSSETVTLTNTSHGLEFENPLEFNRAVLAFIDKH